MDFSGYLGRSLGHEIVGIRNRTLQAIHSKLRTGRISIEDLSLEEELIYNLLHWFDNEETPNCEQVFELLLKFSQNETSARALINMGAVGYLQNHKNCTDPNQHHILDKIIEILVKFDHDNPEPISKRRERLANIQKESTEYFVQPIDFGIVLGANESQFLFDINVKARNTDPRMVKNACNVLKDRVFFDFPPQLFMQKMDVFKSLCTVLNDPRMKSIHKNILECFQVFMERSISTLNISYDSSYGPQQQQQKLLLKGLKNYSHLFITNLPLNNTNLFLEIFTILELLVPYLPYGECNYKNGVNEYTNRIIETIKQAENGITFNQYSYVGYTMIIIEMFKFSKEEIPRSIIEFLSDLPVIFWENENIQVLGANDLISLNDNDRKILSEFNVIEEFYSKEIPSDAPLSKFQCRITGALYLSSKLNVSIYFSELEKASSYAQFIKSLRELKSILVVGKKFHRSLVRDTENYFKLLERFFHTKPTHPNDEVILEEVLDFVKYLIESVHLRPSQLTQVFLLVKNTLIPVISANDDKFSKSLTLSILKFIKTLVDILALESGTDLLISLETESNISSILKNRFLDPQPVNEGDQTPAKEATLCAHSMHLLSSLFSESGWTDKSISNEKLTELLNLFRLIMEQAMDDQKILGRFTGSCLLNDSIFCLSSISSIFYSRNSSWNDPSLLRTISRFKNGPILQKSSYLHLISKTIVNNEDMRKLLEQDPNIFRDAISYLAHSEPMVVKEKSISIFNSLLNFVNSEDSCSKLEEILKHSMNLEKNFDGNLKELVLQYFEHFELIPILCSLLNSSTQQNQQKITITPAVMTELSLFFLNCISVATYEIQGPAFQDIWIPFVGMLKWSSQLNIPNSQNHVLQDELSILELSNIIQSCQNIIETILITLHQNNSLVEYFEKKTKLLERLIDFIELQVPYVVLDESLNNAKESALLLLNNLFESPYGKDIFQIYDKDQDIEYRFSKAILSCLNQSSSSDLKYCACRLLVTVINLHRRTFTKVLDEEEVSENNDSSQSCGEQICSCLLDLYEDVFSTTNQHLLITDTTYEEKTIISKSLSSILSMCYSSKRLAVSAKFMDLLITGIEDIFSILKEFSKKQKEKDVNSDQKEQTEHALFLIEINLEILQSFVFDLDSPKEEALERDLPSLLYNLWKNPSTHSLRKRILRVLINFCANSNMGKHSLLEKPKNKSKSNIAHEIILICKKLKKERGKLIELSYVLLKAFATYSETRSIIFKEKYLDSCAEMLQNNFKAQDSKNLVILLDFLVTLSFSEDGQAAIVKNKRFAEISLEILNLYKKRKKFSRSVKLKAIFLIRNLSFLKSNKIQFLIEEECISTIFDWLIIDDPEFMAYASSCLWGLAYDSQKAKNIIRKQKLNEKLQDFQELLKQKNLEPKNEMEIKEWAELVPNHTSQDENEKEQWYSKVSQVSLKNLQNLLNQ